MGCSSSPSTKNSPEDKKNLFLNRAESNKNIIPSSAPTKKILLQIFLGEFGLNIFQHYFTHILDELDLKNETETKEKIKKINQKTNYFIEIDKDTIYSKAILMAIDEALDVEIGYTHKFIKETKFEKFLNKKRTKFFTSENANMILDFFSGSFMEYRIENFFDEILEKELSLINLPLLNCEFIFEIFVDVRNRYNVALLNLISNYSKKNSKKFLIKNFIHCIFPDKNELNHENVFSSVNSLYTLLNKSDIVNIINETKSKEILKQANYFNTITNSDITTI